jgi:23S rRNA pseudouridine1911/1915/1917 synthase
MTFFHPRWPVFYEDNHLLVLYKPGGLIMQRGSREKPNLVDLAKAWLKVRYGKPGRVFVGMVHRLDAPVAGVLVLARTSKAAGRLSEQFRQGGVEKTYLAVVQGRPERTRDRLVHELARHGRFSRVAGADTASRQTAVLSYRLLENRAARSLLEVNLETGRRHQIRAQLAAIGCPIWGDIHYGADRSLPHGCIALLARKLAIVHPARQTPLRFECPAPEGWPWLLPEQEAQPPLWSIEAYQSNGLVLPERPTRL